MYSIVFKSFQHFSTQKNLCSDVCPVEQIFQDGNQIFKQTTSAVTTCNSFKILIDWLF